MITNLKEIQSDNAKGMKRSVIRELLKLTTQPGLISFAGGLPSPATFPTDKLKLVVDEVLDTDCKAALQYGSTEGVIRLRELILENYLEQGLDINIHNISITTASQQGLDLLAKIFINPGDNVLVGLPSYLGGLSAFKSYGGVPIGIEFDEHGMRSDILEETLEKMKKDGKMPKFIYVIPDFQNPAGITMPEFRRIEILELAKKYDVLVVEDSPYREIRFEGEDQKMLYALDNTGHVIVLGTFSKIFVPGFRIGWIIADEAIVDLFVKAKQAVDLCTSPFVQKIAAKYIDAGYYGENLLRTIALYKEKKEMMMKAFEEFMPEGVTWTNPEGGLFLFVVLPENMDAETLFPKAIEAKVAYVIGTAFYCNGEGKNTMRINFSYPSKDQIVEGVKRLATVIRNEMK
ncbi:MAG: PLP-dependent aminotransferase family protein [Candidatus Cloacimonetes bacterium]|nr:PLP-dependent aminotransferase family protein [Candidatus Cloacimonadota bacterium]